MRWPLVALTALLAFAPLLLRAWRGRRLGALAALAPIPLFALLAVLAWAIDVHFVHSYRHSTHAFWLLALFFFGFGFAFPPLYLALVLLERARCGHSASATRIVAALSLFGGGLAAYSLFVEPATLAERHYVIRSERAPPEGLLILHVSDLQTDGSCRRERLAIEAFAQREPDLVIFSGDIANDVEEESGRAERLAAATDFFGAMRGKLGNFAVLGDWDNGNGWSQFLSELRSRVPVRWLNRELVRLRAGDTPVLVYGMGEPHYYEPSRLTDLPDLRGEPGLRIVATHRADEVAYLLRSGGADLVLAGHTHGGQVVLPIVGALITHEVRGWAGGRYDTMGVPVLVSRGIGMRGAAAPRIRFNCAPEISWIEVRRPEQVTD